MINGKKVLALIQARCSSTRLPRKHLRYIGDKRLMDHVVDRLVGINEIDDIVISTTSDETDVPFIGYAKEKGIDAFCYAGSINDVVGRHYHAAEKHSADYIVVISGDCPLIDEGLIRKQLSKINEGYAYIRPNQECIHEGIDTYSWKCFEFINQNSRSDYARENFGVILRENLNLVNIGYIDIEEEFWGRAFRVSVDNMADLRFMNTLYAQLTDRGKTFDISNAVELVRSYPALMTLNSHVQQKKKGEKTYRIVIKTEAGEGIGLGHLRRMMAFGKFLNENKNNGVFYAINSDDSAIELLDKAGYIYDYKCAETEDEIIYLLNEYNADILIVDVKELKDNGCFDFTKVREKTQIGKIILVDKIIEDKAIDLFMIQGMQSEEFEARAKGRPDLIYGLDCVFINDDFINAKSERERIKEQNDDKNVVISYGGADPWNYTTQTVKDIKKLSLSGNYQFKIILGPYFGFENDLLSELADFPYRYKIVKNPKNYAEELVCADYGIIAYGVSFYEFLFMGIPAILKIPFEGDRGIGERIQKQGMGVLYSMLSDNFQQVSRIKSRRMDIGNLERLYRNIIF